MTTTEAHDTTSPLGVLTIEEITVREGWNPRTTHDEAEHDALTASIRAQGVLQPLLVERSDAGPILLDGHRRLLAARAAGIGTVPVIYRDGAEDEGGQLAAALAANLRRRGLDPIEEARAFSRATEAGWPQRRIAEALGCSRRHVSERLRLLRLPEAVQEAIGAGALPLAAVAPVEMIGAVAPAVAESLATALRAGALSATELTHDPERSLTELADTEGMCASLVAVPGYLDLGALAEHAAAIAARAEAVGIRGVSLSAEDMDAARAFGCLIEFPNREDRYWRRGFVADVDWLADRVRLHVERAEESARQAERRAAEWPAAPSEGGGDEYGAAQVETDDVRRARERAEAKDDRRRARIANLDLGRRALLAYDEPSEITMEMARALVLVALHHHAQDAAQGLRLTHERLQRTETTTTKAGATRERVRYPERHEAEAALVERIDGARTPAQLVGRAVQALVGAFYADQEALPQSERRPADVPGRYGGGIAAGLPALMDALARDVLPERLAAHVRERDAWRDDAADIPPDAVDATQRPDAAEHAEAA